MQVVATLLFAAAIALEPGLGEFHRAVSTKNTEAQKYFDQGMKYLYGFNHESAVKSFQHAGELDPDLAMAWWGVALALGPNINLDVDPDREKQAYEAVQKAKSLEAHASPAERDLIEALTKRYSNDPKADLKKLSVDYSAAMGEVAKRYPKDDDVLTLYAESMMDLHPWKFYDHAGNANEGTTAIVTTLETVLQRNPHHLGANHYYIHAVEASSHPERALKSAELLRNAAPASGHLVHMPAHIFERVGNYFGAAMANTKAAASDRAFITKNGGGGIYALMYYSHNLQFGSASYAMLGDLPEAKKMAEQLAENVKPVLREMPMVESTTAGPMLVLVRFGRWREVLDAPGGEDGTLGQTFRHFARGTAMAKLGNVAGAESEAKALAAARAQVKDDPSMSMFQNPQTAIASIPALLLDGRIAEAKGETDAAIAAYRKAVAAEDALDYDEPPDWPLPARETLGGALLRAHRNADAEQVFRADLAINHDNPRSLWGLAEALRGEKKDASKTMAAFRKEWKGGVLRIADY